MPIVIGPLLRAAARFGLWALVLFFFMAGLLLHFECVSIGSLSHPAGDRPSHSISARSCKHVVAFLSRARQQAVLQPRRYLGAHRYKLVLWLWKSENASGKK